MRSLRACRVVQHHVVAGTAAVGTSAETISIAVYMRVYRSVPGRVNRRSPRGIAARKISAGMPIVSLRTALPIRGPRTGIMIVIKVNTAIGIEWQAEPDCWN